MLAFIPPGIAPALPKTKRTKAQKLLLAAADLIEKEGWVQGRYGPREDAEPGYCAVGAIYKTATGYAHPFRGLNNLGLKNWIRRGYRAADVSAAFLKLNRVAGTPLIPEWNDADDRRQEDVTSAMRAAALL